MSASFWAEGRGWGYLSSQKVCGPGQLHVGVDCHWRKRLHNEMRSRVKTRVCRQWSISRCFSSHKTENLYLLNTNSSFHLGNHHSFFCFCKFDSSQYLILVKSYSIYPFVPGLYYWYNVLKVHPHCDRCQNFLDQWFLTYAGVSVALHSAES